MSQTMQRPVDRASDPDRPPAHPHYTLATLIVLGIIGTVVAVGIAIAAIMITAGRNSVDDEIVAERVEAILGSSVGSAVLPGSSADVDVVGQFVPKAELPMAPGSEVNVAAAPAVPPPSGRTTPAIVAVAFEITEGVSTIDPDSGTTTETWGYKVLGESDAGIVVGTPGPIIRARVGDVLRFTITNPAGNTHPHNVDFHAVTGQGGGAEATTVAPGETKTIEARLLYPGFFMYHCAYGDVPAHISHGMFGGILIDPETPLPDVDHEWYVTQSEYYTSDSGTFDREAVTAEHPSHVVFNGARGALAGDNALAMAVGERARIYFINAGLNLDSNFHPIGSHWDKVYQEAALLNAPLRGSQTTLVPAGGGTVVELVGQVPSTLILVDHALARAFDKGAIGMIVVSGPENPEIFEAIDPTGDEAVATTTAAQQGSVENLSIVPGALDAQPMDAADEFADDETPSDYSVNVLTVPVGTTVIWTNEDSTMHTVTALDGTFDSGFLDNGDSWSFTFDVPGEYEYYCLPHPWMRAKVIVLG